MNTLLAPIVLKELLGLESDLAELRAYAINVGCTFATRDLDADVGGFGVITRRFEAVATRLFALQTQVCAIDPDDLGPRIASVGELVLRAQRILVLMGLEQLKETLAIEAADQVGTVLSPLCILVHRPSNSDDALGYEPLFTAKLGNLDELSSFVRAELARIERLWRPYKPAAPTDSVRSSKPEMVRYVRAIRIALKEMTALGAHRELAAVLNMGRSSIDWPELRTACAQIAAALAIQVLPTLYDRMPARGQERSPCLQ